MEHTHWPQPSGHTAQGWAHNSHRNHSHQKAGKVKTRAGHGCWRTGQHRRPSRCHTHRLGQGNAGAKAPGVPTPHRRPPGRHATLPSVLPPLLEAMLTGKMAAGTHLARRSH